MAVGSSNDFDLVVLGAGTGGYSAAFRAAQLGLKVALAGIAARRDATVKRLWTGLKSLVDKNKVTWIQGQGKLDGPTHVRVKMEPDADNPGGERVLQGTDVILATGSRVKSLPGLDPDGKRIITSDDILSMTALPKDIVIVGAGAVGVEF